MHYLLQHAIDGLAADSPRAPALADGRGVIDYAELVVASNRLAHALRLCSVARQDRVLFCLERGVRGVIAMIAILKADAIYVPLAPRAFGRNARIARDSGARAIICERATLTEAAVLASAGPQPLSIVQLDATVPGSAAEPFLDANAIADLPSSAPDYRNVDTDLAYLLYTSGSTGTPKGVAVSHLNVMSYAAWATEYFGITPEDRVLGTAPFNFDMSTFDVHCTLQRGACLYIAANEDVLFPGKLAAFAREHRPTLWKGVASLLAYLANAGVLESGSMSSLTRIAFAGEPLAARHLRRWMSALPRARFFNAYGPTEATGVSACYAVPGPPQRDADPIPIGRACANTELLLIDAADGAVEPGSVGEICIRGAGLSIGYWNDPVRTAEKFTANPLGGHPGDRIYRTGDRAYADPAGNLVFVGRNDDQVKINGHRVELGEIRRAVMALPGVHDADVVLAPGRGGEELVAFVDHQPCCRLDDMAGALAADLPAYMRPRRWMSLCPLPRTDRGKIDRVALATLLGTEVAA